MRLSRNELVLLALFLAGVVFTLRDYRVWKRMETAGYGRGPTSDQVFAKSLELDGRYQNVLVGMRLSYPSAWKISQNPATADPKYPPKITSRVQIVKIQAENGVELTITAQKTSRNLVDEVDSLATKVTLAREREYISTDKTNITVLTWISGLDTYQAAHLKSADIMFILTSRAPTENWATFAKTFWQIYSSFVPL